MNQNSIKCTKCSDTTWIIINGQARRCDCFQREKAERLFKNSGIDPKQCDFRFNNFKMWSENSRKIKEISVAYYNNFFKIKNSRQNSLCILGQPGCGKTHATIALGLNLLKKKNVAVYYFSYRDVIAKLKSNVLNNEYYQREISKYQKAEILLIDDLLKGKVTDSDKNILFEIINYRYIHHKPIIVSSEYTIESLLDFDEAIGSRIFEMCKDYLVEVEHSSKHNYRMNCVEL